MIDLPKLKPCPVGCKTHELEQTTFPETGDSYWAVTSYHCHWAMHKGFSTAEEAAVAWNARADGWIPVSEPPKERGYYLCVVDYGDRQNAERRLFFPNTGVWVGIGNRVTHWMPTPPLPEPEVS